MGCGQPAPGYHSNSAGPHPLPAQGSCPHPSVHSQLMAWGRWRATRVSPLGLLGQEVKAKGEGLSVHHGLVHFLPVLPAALEHSPGTSWEISLLSLSDAGQCGTCLADKSTPIPPNLPAPKEPGISSPALPWLEPSHLALSLASRPAPARQHLVADTAIPSPRPAVQHGCVRWGCQRSILSSPPDEGGDGSRVTHSCSGLCGRGLALYF